MAAPVPIGDLVHGAAAAVYGDLCTLTSSFPSLNTHERRKGLGEFAKRSRHLLLQAFAALQWGRVVGVVRPRHVVAAAGTIDRRDVPLLLQGVCRELRTDTFCFGRGVSRGDCGYLKLSWLAVFAALLPPTRVLVSVRI